MRIGKAFTFRFISCQVWVFLFWALLIPAQAAEMPRPDAVAQAQATLDRLEQQFAADPAPSARELKAIKEENAGVRASALDCIQRAEPRIEILDSELEVLQPAKPKTTKTETSAEQLSADAETASIPPTITRQLLDLQSRKTSLEGRIATCRLMLLRSNDLDSNIDDYQRNLQTQQLLTRGPTLVQVLQANLDQRGLWLTFVDRFVAKSTAWHVIGPLHLAVAVFFGLLGFILGRVTLHRAPAITDHSKAEAVTPTRFVQALLTSGAGYGPVLLALGSMIGYLTLSSPGGGGPFLIDVLYGLMAFITASAVIRALLNPCPPATHFLPLAESISIPLGRRIHVLALVALVRWLVQRLNADGLLDETMYLLAHQLIGVVWVLNVIWVFWLLRRLDSLRLNWVMLLLGMALFGAMVAAGFGYVNLGALVMTGITYSMALLGVTLVLSQLLSDLFDGLNEGHYGWQKAARRFIGLKDGQYMPGLGWLHLAVNFVLWAGAGLLLLRIWDAAAEQGIVADILRYFTEGFQIGSITIVPTQLFLAFLILAVSLTLTSWFKGRMNTKWLVKTRMEPSSRDALVTTFGYVGSTIAIIVALSIVGINFANLAIIAGALSVGLGFGLQNIVNNFVSGIIMLVERPVRIDDWIVVGDTEGYVQSISIRTTTIRTFDRADVIVPNSDLISGKVTNWTLGNTWGRLIIPIGVGYGSDVETVIKTLVEIGNGHPDVIKGNPKLPDPHALFLDFGDSSLDFELRIIIRDINKRRYVTSDINRAINAEFRKLGIEIPFPQRDLHFRESLRVEHDATPASPAPGDDPSPTS